MNLDELRSAQAKERRKDSLQHLRDSFYDDVAAYVADMRAARDRRAEQVAKPFSDDDVRRLSDEVETAEEVAEALYERRVGKVVKLASFAAADMPVDADGMTAEERQLFDDLVDRIGENKSRVLDVLSGETPPGEETSPAGDGPESPASAGRSAPDAGPPSASDDAGALAGAMGGPDDEVVDATDAESTDGTTMDGTSMDETPMDGRTDEAPPVPPEADALATEDDATSPDGGPAGDGGPTAVPPEPAPPGAPGVSAGGDGDAAPLESLEQSGSESPDRDAPEPSGPVSNAAAESDTDSDLGDRATVRITRDVGSIFGVDEREYDLASEDVVTLPVENADPLVERDAAERLD
ncbi:MAG: hypothetical protein ACOCRD_00560 [Halorubrum sp.]